MIPKKYKKKRNFNLILAQGDAALLDASLGDDGDEDAVAGVDVPFGGWDESVGDEVDGSVDGERSRWLLRHVLQTDLVVQDGLQESWGRAAGTVGVSLAVADGIVGVDVALALVDAGEDVGHVVREEAAAVHHGGHQLGHGVEADLTVLVRVRVLLDAGLQDAGQRVGVAPVAARSQNDLRRQSAELRVLASEDVVSGTQSRISSDDCEVVASDCDDGAEESEICLSSSGG